MSTMRAAMLDYTKRRIEVTRDLVLDDIVSTVVALAEGRHDDAVRHCAAYALRTSALVSLCVVCASLSGDP